MEDGGFQGAGLDGPEPGDLVEGEGEGEGLLAGDDLEVELEGFHDVGAHGCGPGPGGARALSPTSESGTSSIVSSGAVARASEIAIDIRDGALAGFQQLREVAAMDREALQHHLRQQRAGAESSCPVVCQGICRLLFDGLEFAIGVRRGVEEEEVLRAGWKRCWA